MITKLPETGNRVTTWSGSRRGQRGIALISVIAVLVLLAMVATPFLLTMRDSAARGEKFVYGSRADAEAEALFETVRAELVRGLEHVERRKLDASGGLGVAGGPAVADETPSYDTAGEMTMPPDVIARFNRSTAKEHRVWSADIVDTQALFNLNTCSYPVLANILGRAEVAAATTSDRQTIPLSRVPESFPKQDGVVRIGSECIKYKQIVGNDLVNCERGYLGSLPGNGPAHDIDLGEPVMLESCWQIATRPFRWRSDKDGKTIWVSYTNPEQARTIGEMGVAALPPSDYERLRPWVTAWSGNAVGDGWCNPQLLRNGITAGNRADTYAKVKNIRYFGPGTMVKITDGVNDDYAIVTKVRGSDEVALAGKIVHDYQADQARIYCLARSPINVNTADVATLSLVFSGLKMRGRGTAINERQAEELAAWLKQWVPPAVAGAPVPATPEPPGVFRNWEDLTKALEQARDAGKIDQDAFDAVVRNAMNANDSLLQFSTVPFVFRSFDRYEVRATVSIQGTGGHEVARRELRRVMEVSTTRSATVVLESQEDFQNQIVKSRDAKYMCTFPVNVNAQFDGRNVPASEFRAFTQMGLFPSTDRASGVGDVQLLPAAFRTTYGNRKERYQHFDQERIPDGYEIKDGAYTMSVEQTDDPANGKLDLVDTITVEGVGEDVEIGLKQFDVSFWYKPGWSRDSAEHVIFDYGVESDHMNRVSLRYEPQAKKQPPALVLACADATRENRSCEVVYEFDHGTWDTETWYHIAASVHGASPELMSLFVDGESQGRSNVQSRLTNAVPGNGTGGGLTLELEDATYFPDAGCVIVRGRDGIELMEYSQRSGNTLTVHRRKARSIVHSLTDQTLRSHQVGDTVELYGFAGPLLSDVKKGGATLDAQIGPWRAYRMTFEGDTLSRADTGAILCKGLGCPAGGWSSSQQSIDISLAEWDTGSTDTSVMDDLGPAGTEGLALLMTTRIQIVGTPPNFQGLAGSATIANVLQSNQFIGGCDIVHYRVSGTAGSVNIIARGIDLKHATIDIADSAGNSYFFPSHEFGEQTPDNTFVTYDPNSPTPVGANTAFIPIAVLASAGSGEYLDPADREPQLNSSVSIRNNSDPTLRDGHAYIQVDGEWVAYDTYDEVAISGKVAFYRDLRLDNVASLLSAFTNNTSFDNMQMVAPVSNPTTGQGGGSGGNSGNDEPAAATEYNNEGTFPPEPTTAGSANATQPSYAGNQITSVDLARTLDFRGVVRQNTQTQHRIANTIPADHSAGVQVIPAFLVLTGNNVEQDDTQNDGARFAYPGFNDIVTLRDAKGNDEQIRLQWGYMGWCAPVAPTTQTWLWDRPTGQDGNYALRRWDSRTWTRLLKFPSGEMPDNGLTSKKADFLFGKKYDGTGAVTPATIDELTFAKFTRAQQSRTNYAFLGAVPPEVADPNVQVQSTGSAPPAPTVYAGIDDATDEFACHVPYWENQLVYPYGTPVDANTFAQDGGVVRIDDELILFEQFDAETGRFSGCIRGAFNTEPKPHQYGALVVGVHAFPTSRLTAGIDVSSGDYQLADTSDFADDGYLRIGLSNELIGYTNWDTAHLTAPLGRIDPAQDNTPRDPAATDKRVAGSIFRGRFGTVPAAANEGEVAIGMPFRVYDRYAERADDPEQAYLQLSWTKHGAIWKRVTWDEEPRKNIEVIGLLRFSGGPAWDSDKIVRVGQEPIPADDRRKYLYEVSDASQLNLLNVEADRIEVRLGVRFAKGAYDRIAQVAPDNWKESPAIRKVVVEYVAPPQVLTQE